MQQYLEAGRVVTTHGVKGEVKMELWCDGVDFLRPAGKPTMSAQDFYNGRLRGLSAPYGMLGGKTA